MSEDLAFPRNKINVLLLENIHTEAHSALKNNEYNVEGYSKTLSHDDLLEQISNVHVLGIRSKTKVTAEHIAAAKKLLVIGCFGVGTNGVDLDAARERGIPVFNAPYGNTRSVAELAVGDVIFLARKAAEKHAKMQRGFWEKTAKGCHEVRGKTIGIVGYGHIGQQVGIMAEAIGMNVVFYDMIKRLPLGNAQAVDSLDELLATADFTTLHVPAQKDNKPLIGENELAKMKKGSYLLNLSRGTLIDFKALRTALESKHLGGAAIDVYPAEPKTNAEEFECELTGVDNVILTPHLGGSTEEAQLNIGLEVSKAFIKFIDAGSTFGAVNFPQVELPAFPDSHRILHIHKNEPGVLSDINKIVSDVGANINAQFLNTYKNVGYLIMDLNSEASEEVKEKIKSLPSTLRTRALH